MRILIHLYCPHAKESVCNSILYQNKKIIIIESSLLSICCQQNAMCVRCYSMEQKIEIFNNLNQLTEEEQEKQTQIVSNPIMKRTHFVIQFRLLGSF